MSDELMAVAIVVGIIVIGWTLGSALIANLAAFGL